MKTANTPKRDEVVSISGSNAILEVNQKCLTGCGWCYKKGIVSKKGPQVPIKTLKERIDWIATHTDAGTIYPCGGEPLLHPDFVELCEYILSKDLNCSPITSGKVTPAESGNLEYLVDMYREQKITPELSYQHDRNDDEYLELIRRFRQIRRANPLQREEGDESADLMSTVIFGDMPFNKFKKVYDLVFQGVFGIDDNSEVIGGGKRKRFIDVARSNHRKLHSCFNRRYWKSRDFEYNTIITRTDSGNKFIYRLRSMNEDVFSIRDGRVIVRVPCNPDGLCPSMTSSWDDSANTVSVNSFLVRTDGEMTFSRPSCIRAKHTFGNIDELDDDNSIYHSFKEGIERLRNVIMQTKAAGAKNRYDLCKKDSYFPTSKKGDNIVCSGCNYPLACNIHINEELRDYGGCNNIGELIGRWTPIVADQYQK